MCGDLFFDLGIRKNFTHKAKKLLTNVCVSRIIHTRLVETN